MQSSVFLENASHPELQLLRGLPGMGIKPGLQARAGVESRARPADATTTLPRGSAPFLHHQSDFQAIKSACLIDPV